MGVQHVSRILFSFGVRSIELCSVAVSAICASPALLLIAASVSLGSLPTFSTPQDLPKRNRFCHRTKRPLMAPQCRENGSSRSRMAFHRRARPSPSQPAPFVSVQRAASPAQGSVVCNQAAPGSDCPSRPPGKGAGIRATAVKTSQTRPAAPVRGWPRNGPVAVQWRPDICIHKAGIDPRPPLVRRQPVTQLSPGAPNLKRL